MRGMHTGSANRREMNVFEQMALKKHIRRLERGIARVEKRDRKHFAYYARGDHPEGGAAKRRRRQIAEDRLTAANGLVLPEVVTASVPVGK